MTLGTGGEVGRVNESGFANWATKKSAVEALWALGPPGPKKGLKRGLGCGGKDAENSPLVRRFLPLFTGTETYEVNFQILDISHCGPVSQTTMIRDVSTVPRLALTCPC